MKLVLQRVTQASVSVDGKIIAEIGQGLLILAGVGREDNGSQIGWLAKKCAELRIFADEKGKMNLSVKDVSGSTLVVSQFTLFAGCEKGRRPDFLSAAPPAQAEKLYLQFAEALRKEGVSVQTGKFGAMMQISLVNDGPVTIILER
ncbi:MAG: D-tyrosyl-tRNA(Tyr) deacylase [Candidatus Cloacimonetes bacterium]|nr:D-tyrosyl-tRNA(Tyr) deacylase [Candidatus Cloacimonadota bacterium]